MAGKLQSEATSQNDATYESNLRYAVKLFAEEHIIGLIEPINKYSVPNYYLNSYEKGVLFICISYVSICVFNVLQHWL